LTVNRTSELGGAGEARVHLAILTNIVSNNAAAVISTPIAISIAMELGMPLTGLIWLALSVILAVAYVLQEL
jgi:di/tricarboxylate transporter